MVPNRWLQGGRAKTFYSKKKRGNGKQAVRLRGEGQPENNSLGWKKDSSMRKSRMCCQYGGSLVVAKKGFWREKAGGTGGGKKLLHQKEKM